MRTPSVPLGPALAALLIAGGSLVGLGYTVWDKSGEAVAATSEQKAAFQQVLTSLQAVDTAYASGNAAEAQARFGEAKSSWDKVSPAISNREAREAQLLFDSLGNQLKTNAPPKDVKSTVDGMLDELREDIASELD